MQNDQIIPFIYRKQCPICQRWHEEENFVCEDCDEQGELQMLMSKKRYAQRMKDGFRMLRGDWNV